MQMLCMRSRLQPNTESQRIPRTAQQLESEQKAVATMCVSIWELPTRLSTRHQGDEGRELPARLYKHPGTLNSASIRHDDKRSETTWNRCMYAVQQDATDNKTMYTASQNSNHKHISMPNLNAVTSSHPYLKSSELQFIRHDDKRSETTWNRCMYAVQQDATDNKTMYTASQNSNHKHISMPNLNAVTSSHPYLKSSELQLPQTGLQKEDVFAHLTSFKKTFKSNIKRSVLVRGVKRYHSYSKSELSTIDNRRR
ncbi:deoxyribodipyrimidine photo-lyase isoform 1 [Dorcoceras hygrometricum]|uniref:Deoxyribodipyrimidine photo-lyase isoform 1 n=1 Tax=Dorcoceras hygrometricum TaxID=472368 RepID=A0A2Z7BRN2_9LAMI|nr:deoxyribodipyrimidine photo-lyase isoform 1 [Dorcoceras hygrometricum]